jgi:hypothetical protein
VRLVNLKERFFVMKISSIRAIRSYDPDRERLNSLRAQEAERVKHVRALAIGELRRVANMTPDASGKVDMLKLDAALVGQPVDRRLRLKAMLADCDMI